MKKSSKVVDLRNQVKEVINIAKKAGRIKSYKQAFKDFPVSKEIHKGSLDYYTK